MRYYDLALPLNIDQLYTYSSDSELTRGCRVLVSFNNNLLTGFIWSESQPVSENRQNRIKTIIEVIDNKPLLSDDLLELADWMSNYYLCSLGTVLTAMLPTAIQIQIVTEIKLSEKQPIAGSVSLETDSSDTAVSELSKGEKEIINHLHQNEWTNISFLREKLKNISLYKHLEKLEEENIIDIKRTFDRKIKKKYANFIILSDNAADIPKLTAKQQEAWDIIKTQCLALMPEEKRGIPLARLADDFSYSIIKALRSKGLITIEAREVKHVPEMLTTRKIDKEIVFTEEQQELFAEINKQIKQQCFKTFLIYGVTGSGKTEVYIRLIKECLSQSRNALILVPEIALTPQMEERFYTAFGESIAILHSHRNERERWEEWKRIKRKECRIVLGARSAVFAPLDDIGIIIVDEEHESSYKQDKSPRYNARDLAVLRGKRNRAVVLLGSATPSLESWYNAQQGRYRILKLTHRPQKIEMPSVRVIDMKEEDGDSLFSDAMKEKILERLERKEQIILFQNRRGYASYVICIGCGSLHRCPKCDISLIYHSSGNYLLCHYCGHREQMFRKCPDCGSYVLDFGVAGTQQLENQLQILFPKARLLRMDADTTSGKDSYTTMYKRMSEGSVDILFGTQMIAKGLDFPNVTLVGVISADNSLNIPDFRSTERTFQLLTQVAGRSGRGFRKGEVLIQTYNPMHYAVVNAQKQDYDSFVIRELQTRKALYYPPFIRNARLVFSHNNEVFLKEELNRVKPFIAEVRKFYQKGVSDSPSQDKETMRILGPVAAPIHKINNRFRYHIIIKSDSVAHLLKAVKFLIKNAKISKAVKMEVDIDPASLM